MTLKDVYSSDKTMLVILVFISAFPPLSTDLYLPALPQMVKILHATPARVNLTLSLFFAFFGLGILIWGPLSDKYGRKPILYWGLVIYIASSFACALSDNYVQLVTARIFQALGGGAATAVATAIVKDLYAGKKRERVLAMVMALVIMAPVVAPTIGSLLLKVASWRAIFFSLAGFAAISLILVIPLEETLKTRYQGSPLRSLGRLFVVLKNPGLSWLLVTFSIVVMPFMGFIAASSYVYIDGFGLSEQSFSLFFAANALCAMIGPILYLRISRWLHSETIITWSYIMMVVSGIMVVTLGILSPVLFALTVMPATLAATVMRPPSANLMLDQQKGDTGSVSSLINFFGMIMGSIGMMLVSLGTGHLVAFIGMMQMIVGSIGFLFWVSVKNKDFVIL